MDFRFTDEQQLWYDTLLGFMDKEVGREYTREHDENRVFPYEAYKKIADNGWLGILIPEEDGGMAADAVTCAVFCESRAQRSVAPAPRVLTGMLAGTNIDSEATLRATGHAQTALSAVD